VIPVYGQLRLLERAVSSAREGARPLEVRFVFADDASAEKGVREFCVANGRYVRQPRRRGFAATCNLGVGMTAGETFVLLNSDTEARPGWLAALVAEMRDDVAVVGPLLLFAEGGASSDPTIRPPGMVQSCGFAYNVQSLPYHRLIGWRPDHARVQDRRDDLQGITGACWLVKRSVWRQLRGLEESYGSYFEDADYCLRARAAGYKIVYTPEAVLTHVVGASQDDGAMQGYMQRNAAIFLERNMARIRYDEFLVT
jgi:O-antigen biosynthesis protein